MQNNIKNIFTFNKNEISRIENSIRLFDPQLIFKRGYSYTTFNGSVVKNINNIKKDDIIKTHIADGVFESIVR
ncbi:MAG: exodeoxyribonuclease VII large subunit [Saprospiraceae bacterium]